MTAMTLHRPRLKARRLTDVLSHGYIWFCLVLFVLPFVALLTQSLGERGGTSGIDNYADVFGSFGDNLLWSFKISGLALLVDLAVCLPAACGDAWLVRTRTRASTASVRPRRGQESSSPPAERFACNPWAPARRANP